MNARNSIMFDLNQEESPLIKVIGVGGGGCNAVNNMYRNGIKGVDFIICNTDLQALKNSPVQTRIQLGKRNTDGLGAGARPERGRQAALEALDEIASQLEGTRMVFVTAGMGGGTGTGAAPVIANLARERGILTVGIVTTPFAFEGNKRRDIATEGLLEMEQAVDTLLVIDNETLMKVVPRKLAMKDAYKVADEVLCSAAKGIAELITCVGYVNVDFNDVVTVMKDTGTAIMGLATARGDDRARIALEEAFTSPLLVNTNIAGATGVLLNIETSEESAITVEEMATIGELIKERVGSEPMIIYGNVFTEGFGDHMSITLIVTGFPRTDAQRQARSQEAARRSESKPAPTSRKVESAALSEHAEPLTKVAREPEPTEPALAPVLREERNYPYDFRALPNLQDTSMRRSIRDLQELSSEDELRRYEAEPAYLRFHVDLERDAETSSQLSRSRVTRQGRLVGGDSNGYLFNHVD
jgi:cell division protein FtsZ